MPAGDVYGGGSPTGICFYEGGALGETYAGGLLLSCEPAKCSLWLFTSSGRGRFQTGTI